MIQKLPQSETLLKLRSESQASCSADKCLASKWNALWQTSGDAMPLSRWECLEKIVDGWQPGNGLTSSEIATVAARDRGDLVAALPLVDSRLWKVFRCHRSPNNPWLQGGSLLTDRDRISETTYQHLADEIISLPSSFVMLDWMYETIEVERLVDVLQQKGCRVERKVQFQTGQIKIEGSWDDYFASRSKNFRKAMRSSLKRLSAHGAVQFERFTSFKDEEELELLLNEALEIEHHSWKGGQGTSILSDPGIAENFRSVLREVADAGLLEIQFLTVGGRRIAFEIGYRAHGTWYSHKVSYDPQFARFSPGQLLIYLQLQTWFETGEVALVDTVAELIESTARWCNHQKPVFQYRIATGGFVSNAILGLIGKLRPMAKRISGGLAIIWSPN